MALDQSSVDSLIFTSLLFREGPLICENESCKILRAKWKQNARHDTREIKWQRTWGIPNLQTYRSMEITESIAFTIIIHFSDTDLYLSKT